MGYKVVSNQRKGKRAREGSYPKCLEWSWSNPLPQGTLGLQNNPKCDFFREKWRKVGNSLFSQGLLAWDYKATSPSSGLREKWDGQDQIHHLTKGSPPITPPLLHQTSVVAKQSPWISLFHEPYRGRPDPNSASNSCLSMVLISLCTSALSATVPSISESFFTIDKVGIIILSELTGLFGITLGMVCRWEGLFRLND